MVESRTLGKRAMPMSVKITKAAFRRDLMMSRRIDGALWCFALDHRDGRDRGRRRFAS